MSLMSKVKKALGRDREAPKYVPGPDARQVQARQEYLERMLIERQHRRDLVKAQLRALGGK